MVLDRDITIQLPIIHIPRSIPLLVPLLFVYIVYYSFSHINIIILPYVKLFGLILCVGLWLILAGVVKVYVSHLTDPGIKPSLSETLQSCTRQPGSYQYHYFGLNQEKSTSDTVVDSNFLQNAVPVQMVKFFIETQITQFVTVDVRALVPELQKLKVLVTQFLPAKRNFNFEAPSSKNLIIDFANYFPNTLYARYIHARPTCASRKNV